MCIRDSNTTDGVSTSGTNGMLDVANRIIIGYGMSNMTMYEFQPSVAAFYDGSVYYPKQLITANKPWSGYYEIGNGLVMTMHFTNFIKKGWQYITSGCYGCLLYTSSGIIYGNQDSDTWNNR